jgi:hypothetical protein
MDLPPLSADSAHLGNWIAPDDVEALIPVLARQYYQRYRNDFVGDSDDLEQVARIALWQRWGIGGDNPPERVRELEALSVLTGAIRQEIEQTKRSGPLVLPSQEIDWEVLTTADRSLSEHQLYVLECFRIAVSQIVRSPNYEMMWLVLGCKWTPEEVTLYFRRKKDDRKRFPPDEVRRRVEEGSRKVRLHLDRMYEWELNTLSCKWW